MPGVRQRGDRRRRWFYQSLSRVFAYGKTDGGTTRCCYRFGSGAGDKHVVLVGATNAPWEIDSALMRRFDKRVYIGMPTAEARAQALWLHTTQSGQQHR